MQAPPQPTASVQRLVNVGLAITVGLSIVGFAVGTRPIAPTSGPESERAIGVVTAPEGVLPGRPCLELRERRYGPNSAVTGDLEPLRAGFPRLGAAVVLTEAERARALNARAKGRAYHGAPPTIPHPINQQAATMCLACHERGIQVEGRTASVLSHSFRTNCTQCHVTQSSELHPSSQPPAGDNRFAPLADSARGSRAWAGAPPTIPHAVWMREDCASCHGVTGRQGIRTTHPERQHCRQCHAASAEQFPFTPQ